MLPNQGHAIHLPMARAATHSFVHMNAVVEVSEVGQVVDPRPANRFVGAKAIAHRLEHWAGGPDLRMTVHAGLGRRNTCNSRDFDTCVAITAVNADRRDMVLMAERDWLLARHSGLRHITGTIHCNNHRENAGDDKD